MFFVFHFSAPRLWKCGNRVVCDFQGLCPSFPQPSCFTRSSSAEDGQTSSVLPPACSARLRCRFRRLPFALTPRPWSPAALVVISGTPQNARICSRLSRSPFCTLTLNSQHAGSDLLQAHSALETNLRFGLILRSTRRRSSIFSLKNEPEGGSGATAARPPF